MRHDQIHRILFRLRLWQGIPGRLKQTWLGLQGARVCEGTRLPWSVWVNWPSQLAVGRNCIIEKGVSFDYCHGVPRPGPNIVIGDDTFVGKYCEFNIRASIEVGNNCLIASGCKFIDHDHGIRSGMAMRLQEQVESPIVIADDVWLGVNVVVLKGVTIGSGAIVGAGAVVTRPIPPMEIWAGVPAKRIASRVASANKSTSLGAAEITTSG